MMVRALTKEMGVFALAFVLAAWMLTAHLGAADTAGGLPTVPPPEPAAVLAPSEVPLAPPPLRDGAAQLSGRNPFSAADPWTDPEPEPLASPPEPDAERVLPLLVTDDEGRPVTPAAPVTRSLGQGGGGR
jgi:hypothetical protein